MIVLPEFPVPVRQTMLSVKPIMTLAGQKNLQNVLENVTVRL